MAEFPALDIWTDAYLADTGDLTDAEHGCYLIMLMIAWRRPDNDLEDDMEWLRRAIGAHCRKMHGNHFAAIVPGLLKRFWRLSTNPSTGRPVWTQKRLEKEREMRRKLSENGRDNARKRWSGTSKNKDLPDAVASDVAYAPRPVVSKKEESNLFNAPGTVGPKDHPAGKFPNGSVTIQDPGDRVARFQAHLVDHLLKVHAAKDHDAAWTLVAAAFDTQNRQHARALAICRKHAAEMGKGWPLTPPVRPP